MSSAFAPSAVTVGPGALPSWAAPERRLTAAAKEALLFAAGLAISPLLFAFYGLSTGALHYWYLDCIRFVFDVYFAPQPLARVFDRLATVLVKNLWWLT